MTGTAASTLRLLDGFDLRDDSGTPARIPSGTRRLVAYLALSGCSMPRAYVAAQLWKDSSERGAMGGLRSALWSLRQSGCTVVEATRDTLTLVDDIVIDLTDATERAQTLIRGACPSVDAVGAEDFTRSLLPDWYDDWVLFERERVRQLFLHALDELTIRLSEDGRHAEAIDAGLAAIRVEPLRESTWRALMQVHLAEGNRNEALRCFRTYSRMVQSELGFGPSDGMCRLAERVRGS